MTFSHPALAMLLQRAYSGEMAAALAYVGHARSLRCPQAKSAVKQIEDDEWKHRQNVLALMRKYEVPVSRAYEAYFFCIGKIIALSCHVIGRFMPYFFAGKLESGNVCEYFVMMRYFHELGIHDHDEMLYEMGMKEKEHEMYFLAQIEGDRFLPFFERVFSWGREKKINDVDLAHPAPVSESGSYCKDYEKRHRPAAKGGEDVTVR
jgi:hypothetical protein